MSERLTLSASDGGTVPAYVRRPGPGRAPGIVVLHENMGLNAHIRQVCDRLAGEGFAVVAPDLFWRIEPGIELGYGEQDMDRAFEIYQEIDFDRTVADIVDCVAQVRAQPWCTQRVGIVGFCLGGRMAYQAAASGTVDCAVGYYGVGIDRLLPLAETIHCPLMLHFGTEDKLAPPKVVAKIAAKLAEKPNVRIHSYEGADHGFNCDARAAYDEEASRLAWTRSLALLRETLGSTDRPD
jgi:carboxymethylenebutenolidase